jgi:F-type H+-transporting ATPase subunit delta
MTSRAAATRYARALFDVALKEGDIQQVERDLTAFADLIAGHPELARILGNPAIPMARKRAVVEQLIARAGTISPIVAKLLVLMADRDRLALIGDVAAAYRSRLMDHANIVRAEVTTAAALPADRLAALQHGLASATGRQVQLEHRVDPSIIGGAVTRIGSTVFDGSITTQLQKLKQTLIDAEA